MSTVMLRRAMRDLWRTALWYGLGMAVFALFIVVYYRSFSDNADALQQLLDTFPEGLLVAFGVTDLTTLPGFVGAEFLNLIWPLIMAVFVIMAGAAVVAQEVERGTAELWLSVPEPRSRLLLGKLVALLGAVVCLVLITLLSIKIGALLIDEPLGLGPLAATGVVMLAFSVAVGGYTVLLSSVTNERSKPAGIAAAITLGFYLLWLLGSLSERWSWLEKLSIFTPYRPTEALASATLSLPGVLILFAIGLLGSAAAVVLFARRDVAV